MARPVVIPAKAGIQANNAQKKMDPRLRGDDTWMHHRCIGHSNINSAVEPAEIHSKETKPDFTTT